MHFYTENMIIRQEILIVIFLYMDVVCLNSPTGVTYVVISCIFFCDGSSSEHHLLKEIAEDSLTTDCSCRNLPKLDSIDNTLGISYVPKGGKRDSLMLRHTTEANPSQLGGLKGKPPITISFPTGVPSAVEFFQRLGCKMFIKNWKRSALI